MRKIELSLLKYTMPELSVYQERSSSRSGFRGRDISPDSVIFTLESNFSLFSSTSASVDRCSFASDAHDHDSLASDIVSVHLAGHESGSNGGGNELLQEASSGPDQDPDPNKLQLVPSSSSNKQSHVNTRCVFAKVEKAKKVQKEDSSKVFELFEDDNTSTLHLIDSARNSFSNALKECQERRSRSEALTKKPTDRRSRPASLDLNNVIATSSSSPRLSNIKKSTGTVLASSRKSSGTFPSPGSTPNYHQATSVGIMHNKGWSSERVPLHNNTSRRPQQMYPNNNNNNISNSSLLLPFNGNGRALPSKWEDAERWIFSPVSGDGGIRTSSSSSINNQLPQRRPKSKSGPLGPPGIAYNSLYSPAPTLFDGVNFGNHFLSAASPFSTAAAAFNCNNNAMNNSDSVGFPVRPEPSIARSVSVHGCSDVLALSSLPSQEENVDGVVKDTATDLGSVSRRDMATQMSPEGSNCSSPSRRRTSFSASTPSANLPLVELQSLNSSKSEVRDVLVDERVTVTRWSKKHRPRNQRKNLEIVDDWRKKSVDARSRSSAWDVSDAAKSISKAKRDEAKITAWENLQKAKAEAAIRKLEMKLEKKRSSSMDKIMNKLRSAQKKAQEMRSSVLANRTQQVSKSPHKALSFRRTRQMGSLSGCFTCHAF